MIISELVEKSNDAIHHYDDVEAKKLIKEWDDVIVSQNIEKTDPALFIKVQQMLVHLRIAAFPQLSEKEAADVLRFHFLESFDIEVSMENRLTVSLFSLPEIPRDQLREKLKKALMENNQKLGPLTVSQWINSFEKKYPVKNRLMSAPIDFIASSQDAMNLDPRSRERLKELIHTYDYFLVTTLPATGAELIKILNSPGGTGPEIPEGLWHAKTENIHNISAQEELNKNYIKNNAETVKINLNDALKKYPEAGEQLITSQKIELKSFHEPVRPSVKNWLADYVHLLGYEDHDAIERSNFLFHTTNTRKLSEPDRERLAYILKAFDEKTPVDIDPVRKMIVFNFPPKVPVKAPAVQLSPRYSPSISNTKPVQQINRFAAVSKPVPSPADDYIVRPLPRGKVEISKQFGSQVPLKEGERDSFQVKSQPSASSDYESFRINKSEPEQKLSAGKIFAPIKDSNIQEAKFDFPQRMPFEKEQEKKPVPSNSDLQPYRITSSSYRRDDTQKKPDINPNNIIDLKNPQ